MLYSHHSLYRSIDAGLRLVDSAAVYLAIGRITVYTPIRPETSLGTCARKHLEVNCRRISSRLAKHFIFFLYITE